MVTGGMTMSLCRSVRHASRLVFRASDVRLPDFRNKFGALHQSYTPNKERELYSMQKLALRLCRWLNPTSRSSPDSCH